MRLFAAVLAAAALATAGARAGGEPFTIAVHARSLAPGELAVLSITAAPAVTTLTVHAFNHDMPSFRTAPGVWEALVGIDLDVTAGTHPVTVDGTSPAGGARTIYPLVVGRRKFPTRALRVDDAFVHPPPDVSERIAREAAELTDLWAHPSPERLWSGHFVRPVPGPANSRFGSRSVFNGAPRYPHAGADFLSAAGTPIEAPAAGRVVLAADLYFSGNTVVIDHGQGLFSTLAHMSTMAVQAGEIVSAGHVLGRVGATGRVTGPHLHWAVRVAGARVDPVSVLEVLGG